MLWRTTNLLVRRVQLRVWNNTMSTSSSDQEDLPRIDVTKKSPAVQASIRRQTLKSDEIVVLDDSPPRSVRKRSAVRKSPVKCNSSIETIILDDSPERPCRPAVSSPTSDSRLRRSCARISSTPVKTRCSTTEHVVSQSETGMPQMKRWKGKDSEGKRPMKDKAKKNLKDVDSDMEDVLRASSDDRGSTQGKKGSTSNVKMVVILDQVLGDRSDFMTEFLGQATKANVQYHVEESLVPGSVQWMWSAMGREQNGSARTVAMRALDQGYENMENRMLVTMDAPGFLGLVYYSKEVICGRAVPAGSVTLEQHVAELYADNPGVEISLVVEGMEAYRRGQKVRKNRKFRQQCLESSSSSKGNRASGAKLKDKGPCSERFSEVSENDCEEALIRLQLDNGCVVKMCKTVAELAAYILCLTKSLCSAHDKKESPLNFCYESLRRPSKKDLSESKDKVCLLWKYMLKEFNDVSMDMATAIADVYPSPHLLLEAYSKCKTTKEKETLLRDIVVRRGVGVLASSRKLGPVQSKRIYIMMTSDNPVTILQ